MSRPEVIAAAIFEKPGAQVLEANSDFDVEPREFRSAEALSLYIAERLARPKGFVFVFVRYPDMAGRAELRRTALKPGSVPGHTHRYNYEGWGLISVQLHRDDAPGAESRISSNSERRAQKWAPTRPDLDPPHTWNWPAVARHTRRLQRALRAS